MWLVVLLVCGVDCFVILEVGWVDVDLVWVC